MSDKFVIGYFYKDELNLYGDTGNVDVLEWRARKRGLTTEVVVVGVNDALDAERMKRINVLFMGGGSDFGQKSMYTDLMQNKGNYIRDYILSGGFALLICGSYQLMGTYYKSADGTMLEGLHVFDYYTQHFGYDKKRCTGNVVAKLNSRILDNPVFSSVNSLGSELVGFENHGGRTYLGESLESLATIEMGFGNNGEDKTEGIFFNNAIGTYLHGPVLSRNAHLADFLIAKSLGIDKLEKLDDSLIKAAYTASKNLSQ